MEKVTERCLACFFDGVPPSRVTLRMAGYMPKARAGVGDSSMSESGSSVRYLPGTRHPNSELKQKFENFLGEKDILRKCK